MRQLIGLLAAGMLLGTMVPMDALAAKLARITSATATMYDKPASGARAVARLRKGTPVATSDRASRGFYRAKTRDGKLGWIRAADLDFTRRSASSATSRSRSRPARPSSGSVAHPVSIKILAGYNTFALKSAVQRAFEFPVSAGIGYGAELGYKLSPSLGLLFRFEQLTGAANVSTTAGTNVDDKYQMSAKSLPALAGISYQWMGSGTDGLTADLGLLGGYALGTGISLQATGNLTGTTEYSKAAPVFVVRTGADWNLSPNFMIFGELGYRMLSANVASPTAVGAGSGILDPDGDGTLEPAAIKMSGILFFTGVGFRF